MTFPASSVLAMIDTLFNRYDANRYAVVHLSGAQWMYVGGGSIHW